MRLITLRPEFDSRPRNQSYNLMPYPGYDTITTKRPNYEFWAAEEAVHALLNMLVDMEAIHKFNPNSYKYMNDYVARHTKMRRNIYTDKNGIETQDD